ncbi:MAG TPA: zinc ribbon domain-containing protein, partial [Verrucomicrobiae bacterium]|nr:zinc ribbon domain-containing protein [Verrucomicrobiae bacterium]
MSEIKFACPSCQQHIQCGPEYSGMEIPCPACQSKMTVPAPAGFAAPPPPPAPALRTSASATAVAPPPPAAMTATGSPACPNCGNEVSPRAIMCVKCGTNLKTGQKVSRPGMPGVSARTTMVAAAAGPTVWYKTAYPYLGAYFAVLALV